MTESIINLLDEYPEPIRRSIDLAFELTSDTGARYQMGLVDPILRQYMPMQRYIDAKLAFLKMSPMKPTLAFIVGVDGEYPIKKEPVEFSIEMVGSVKIARARLFSETDFDLLHDAELNLRANNTQVYNAFIQRFMQVPAYLTQTIVSLCNVLTCQLFVSATSTYIDPETNLGFEISYLNQVPATNRPAALTGASLWSATATATPLENIRDHLNAYYENVYAFPDAIAMPAAMADYMRAADDTRRKIAAMKGTFGVPTGEVSSLPRPTIDECRQWLQGEVTSAARNTGIPEFIVTDSIYYTKDTNDSDIERPYLSNDTYSFLRTGIVEGAFVPTATNDYASSFATVTEIVSRAPKREKLSMDTRFLAVCYDPRYLGWRQVL